MVPNLLSEAVDVILVVLQMLALVLSRCLARSRRLSTSSSVCCRYGAGAVMVPDSLLEAVDVILVVPQMLALALSLCQTRCWRPSISSPWAADVGSALS